MELSATGRIVAVLMALALVIGGAGVGHPLLQLLLLLAAIGAGSAIFMRRRPLVLTSWQQAALVILAAILLLPLLQLIPLPPAWWQSLPGRQVPASVDAAIGISRWRPISLDVEGTLRSFLIMIPATVVFAASLTLPRRERIRLLWVVAGIAAAAAVLSVLQVATGGALSVYRSSHDRTATGLFVNRNHNAAFMLCAMVLTSALLGTLGDKALKPGGRTLAGVGTILLFATATLGTTSRMGLVLLPVAVLGSLPALFARRMDVRLVTLSTVALTALAAILAAAGSFARVTERFTGFNDQRLNFWTDIRWALDYYGLVGTGIGSFVPVFRSAESLESVVPQIVNHAHNDYLEILLESGLAGAVLAAVSVTFLALTAWRSIRTSRHPERLLPTAASAMAIVILLAASLVDYPLRMPAISCTFALLAAVLLDSPRKAAADGAALVAVDAPSRRPIGRIVLAASAALVLAVLGVQASLSARALLRGDAAAAAQVAPWSTAAHEILADRALRANDLVGARTAGASAIALSPISVPGIRSIGLATAASGQTNRGNRIMEQAAILGWRDPLTQLWALDASARTGEADKAVQRAEALFRTKNYVAPAVLALMNSPAAQDAAEPLAMALAANPQWRGKVLKVGASLPPPALANWAGVLSVLNRSAVPLTDREAKPTLHALSRAGRNDLAQLVFSGMRRSGNFLSNGDFETLDEADSTPQPAAWHVRSGARESVAIGVPAGGRDSARALRVTGGGRDILARQTVILPPGTYEFSFRGLAADRLGASVRWEFRCQGSEAIQTAEATVPGDGKWRKFHEKFDVPESDCPVQTLAFGRHGDMLEGEFWIDDVALRERPVNRR